MIGLKLKMDWGQSLYLKNDPDQCPRTLVGIYLTPGNQVVYTLSYLGDLLEAYDFEISEEVDQEILLNLPKKED